MQQIDNPLQAAYNLAGLREILLRPGTTVSPKINDALLHLDDQINLLVTAFVVKRDAPPNSASAVPNGTEGLQAGVGNGDGGPTGG